MTKTEKILTFDRNHNLRHTRQNFVRTFLDKIIDAFFYNKVVGVASFGEAIEEHRQVVMEVQFFYWHLLQVLIFMIRFLNPLPIWLWYCLSTKWILKFRLQCQILYRLWMLLKKKTVQKCRWKEICHYYFYKDRKTQRNISNDLDCWLAGLEPATLSYRG